MTPLDYTAVEGDEMSYCAHGIHLTVDCLDCDVALSDEPELPYGDPCRDFADSVGMPLHEKM